MPTCYDSIVLAQILSVLRLTPDRLEPLISGLDQETIDYRPHQDHFSIRDIIGHFIHGEIDDWIPRIQMILEHEGIDDIPTFVSFDRFAHKQFVNNFTVEDLLTKFAEKRSENLHTLSELEITPSQLKLEGTHPSLGRVNLRWLLNCWVAHDLSHLNQINRILVSRFDEVGPWKEYLRILKE